MLVVRLIALFLGVLIVALPWGIQADCSLPNPPFAPLNDLGSGLYQGFAGGLYPNGNNMRPVGHEAAGIEIARNQIRPLNGAGNVDTNSGKIVLLSLGMSNTTQEWASGDTVTRDKTRTFKYRADHDAAKNPQLVIVDGAQSGQDAPAWTNLDGATWGLVITQRLAQAGVTTNQVQVMWLKQALASPQNYGAFPLHAEALQRYLSIIVRNAKAKYPNLKLLYLTGRSHAWVNGPPGLNPEPFAYETSFGDKWLIEDQIGGRPDLNYNPANGAVAAPWIAWGPYVWAAGTNPRSDGMVWNCDDCRQNDFTHPSSNGVYKVASQLLAFFKTDPTAAPWFLKTPTVPLIAKLTASTTNGTAPLTVNFTARVSGSGVGAEVTNYVWTFDDGCYSMEQNPTKLFPAPGSYTVHMTAEDSNGNAAMASLTITVGAPVLEITSAAQRANGLQLTWTTRGGESYFVEGTTNLSEGFSVVSPLISAPPAAVSVTNFMDATGQSNVPARYYRVRLGP
jgi:PKD repeat protein